MNYIFFIFASIMLNIFSASSWATKSTLPAHCTYTVSNGYTQTISYSCSSSVNLNGAIIQFTVDNPSGLTNLNSVWGFINLPLYPVNPLLSVNGNTVTLALNFQSNPVTLTANQTTNFSYSTSNNVNVTSFALYPASSASLNITLTNTKPADVSNNNVLVHVMDPANVDHPISVPWGGQALLSGLTVGSQYTLSADTINGQKNQYQFTLVPPTIILSNGQNNVTLSAQSTPLPTGTANITITGLPSGQMTSLFFNYNLGSSTQTITFNNVQNGSHSYILPAGFLYNISAQIVFADGFSYSTNPISLNIQPNTTSSANLPFIQKTLQSVNGWPNYIAMGAVTDDTPATTTSLQSRPVDAIFKYGGLGGNGDPGQIIYPIFDLETADQAQALTTFYQQKGGTNIVKPVMVIYTAQMSGRTSFTDFEYTNLVMHYITLLMESQKLESYKSAQNPFPASILLNPDLFGMIQQENLLPALNTAISSVSLQTALKTAVCFVTLPISTQYGQNLNYEALFRAIRLQTTDNWSAMSTWDQFKMQYFNACTANPTIPGNISIPSFTNDFPGWVQSTNWIIRQFAPDITFGWQENLWGIGSSNWVHQNYDPATLKSTIADPTAATIIAAGAYSGNYMPDFLAFDKYEMDSIPSATGVGYLFNARDWSNVLLYVKNISESLGTIPVMLWQIPGGHLQIVNDIDTRINHASTEPDFFFGDAINPLNSLQSFISSTPLSASIYGTTNMKTYLSMNESGTTGSYTWQTNHLPLAANSHVFAILWGGGNTTSVGTFPSNDNGWLANKIIQYYKNPVPTLAKSN